MAVQFTGGCGTGTSLADFKQLALLGEGAYSSVYKVRRLADNETYALKKVKLPSLSDKEKKNALNEIRLLASVTHDNIISYKEAFFDDATRCLCIVTECADGGDLLQRVVKCQKERKHLNEADLWRYFIGLGRALQALHAMRILHRDIKCANVFLSHTKSGATIAKLGDFNVSAVATRGLCMTQTGTPYYASPEVWRDMPYDGKSDIWSLGCVLYEATALRPPFQAQDMEGLYRKVLRGAYPRIPGHFSQDLVEVIAAMLQVNPRNRPTAEQLLQLPIVRSRAADAGTAIAALSEDACASKLLQTIKVSRNIVDLSMYLPRARYDTDVESSAGLVGSQDRQEESGSTPAVPSRRPAAEPGDAPRERERDRERGGAARSVPPRSKREHAGGGGAVRLPRVEKDSRDQALPPRLAEAAGGGAGGAVLRLPRIASTPNALVAAAA